MARPPLLTKPAGVFVQLLGAVLLFSGIAAFLSGAGGLGVFLAIVAIGLFWLGRQTHPSNGGPDGGGR